MLEHLGPEHIKEYHAFVPDEKNFQQLEAFVRTLPADLLSMRTCHHAAVGDENAFVSIAKREANSHMFLVKAQLLKAFNV